MQQPLRIEPLFAHIPQAAVVGTSSWTAWRPGDSVRSMRPGVGGACNWQQYIAPIPVHNQGAGRCKPSMLQGGSPPCGRIWKRRSNPLTGQRGAAWERPSTPEECSSACCINATGACVFHPHAPRSLACLRDVADDIYVSGSIAGRPTDAAGGPVELPLHYNPDCAGLASLWGGGGLATGLFVDVGANIGTCTLHMLLATAATVVAFEPSPTNLFFLTKSVAAVPNIRPHRIMVYPLAMGMNQNQSTSTLFRSPNNAGNSMVGRFVADRRAQKPIVEGALVWALDAVLWPDRNSAPPCIQLLKVDTQGMECKVLEGARALLASGAVQTLSAELDERRLRRNGCSKKELQDKMLSFGMVRISDRDYGLDKIAQLQTGHPRHCRQVTESHAVQHA